jgi:RNA polymerase subunit RPABC4/transcription elongation factor Spt4
VQGVILIELVFYFICLTFSRYLYSRYKTIFYSRYKEAKKCFERTLLISPNYQAALQNYQAVHAKIKKIGDIDRQILCPNCRETIFEDDMICPLCEHRLLFCPNCGDRMSDNNRNCPHCGNTNLYVGSKVNLQ